jgi:hypothetical protein
MKTVGAAVSALPLLSLLLLSGCVAEMVQKHPPRRSTVPGVGYIELGGGDVRYSVDGWGIVVSMRRHRALSKMRAVCKTKQKDLEPKINDEYTHNDVDSIYSADELDVNLQHGLEQYHVAPYHHLVFDCKLIEKPAPKTAQDKKP